MPGSAAGAGFSGAGPGSAGPGRAMPSSASVSRSTTTRSCSRGTPGSGVPWVVVFTEYSVLIASAGVQKGKPLLNSTWLITSAW